MTPEREPTFKAPKLDGVTTAPQLDQHLGRHLGDGSDPAADNAIRAGFAATAVKAFANRVGLNYEDLATTLPDLLCDLMHLCDALDLSFEDMVDRAHSHHTPEVHGEL